jgi:hypothetical protein
MATTSPVSTTFASKTTPNDPLPIILSAEYEMFCGSRAAVRGDDSITVIDAAVAAVAASVMAASGAAEKIEDDDVVQRADQSCAPFAIPVKHLWQKRDGDVWNGTTDRTYRPNGLYRDRGSGLLRMRCDRGWIERNQIHKTTPKSELFGSVDRGMCLAWHGVTNGSNQSWS